jgi:NitT/TauT family transport system substrate-binding protein
MVPEDGPQTALNALAAYVANFPKDKIDISKIWTNDFVAKANQKYPNA